MTTKKCTKCNLIKDSEEFSLIKARGGGKRKAKCKSCISAETYKWQKEKNLEAAKIKRREQHIRELYCVY